MEIVDGRLTLMTIQYSVLMPIHPKKTPHHDYAKGVFFRFYNSVEFAK